MADWIGESRSFPEMPGGLRLGGEQDGALAVPLGPGFPGVEVYESSLVLGEPT